MQRPIKRHKVYCAYNTITGKVYVGKTKHPVSKRILEHLNQKNNKSPFQKAFQKYGLDAFRIGVIDDARTIKSINKKERHWIKKLNCRIPNGYNVTKGGDGLTVDHLPKAHRLAIGRAHKGKKHPKAVIEKMIASRKLVPPCSKATSKHMSKSQKKRFAKPGAIRRGWHHTKKSRRLMSISQSKPRMSEERLCQTIECGRLYLKGYSSMELATYFKVKKCTILNWLNRRGVPRRKIWETRRLRKKLLLPKLL